MKNYKRLIKSNLFLYRVFLKFKDFYLNLYAFSYALFLRIFKAKTFVFNDTNLPYFFHAYNKTWNNERTVEIPIILELIKNNYNEVRPYMLEVGNVLSHYGYRGHTVLDKYEEGGGVLNIDIVDYEPKNRYKYVVSISTLEHVGWDESPRDDHKIESALSKIKDLLLDEGVFIGTVPLGYNPILDSLLVSSKIKGFDKYFMVRNVISGGWEQTPHKSINSEMLSYNASVPTANTVCIISINKNV